MRRQTVRPWFVSVAGVLLLLLLPLHGMAQEGGGKAAAGNVYKGKVVGKSNKAKTISIEVGDTVEMVKFNEQTQGLEHASPGEAAIIAYEKKNGERLATVIKPKLAKLPAGVAEMQPDELAALVAQGPEKGRYFLVDARPAKRYAQGHIPTAVSIPVDELKEKGKALLPDAQQARDLQLIFYCGGPT